MARHSLARSPHSRRYGALDGVSLWCLLLDVLPRSSAWGQLLGRSQIDSSSLGDCCGDRSWRSTGPFGPDRRRTGAYPRAGFERKFRKGVARLLLSQKANR